MVTDMVWIMDFKSEPWWKAFATIWSRRLLGSSRIWQWNKSTFLHRLESHKDSLENIKCWGASVSAVNPTRSDLNIHKAAPLMTVPDRTLTTFPPVWTQPVLLKDWLPFHDNGFMAGSFRCLRLVKVMLEVRLGNSPRLLQDSFMKPHRASYDLTIKCPTLHFL